MTKQDEQDLRCLYCGSALKGKQPGREEAMAILRDVSEEHMVSVWEMQSKHRRQDFVQARVCVAKRMRSELHFSLKMIGYYLGGRDHSTIIHLLNHA